MADGTSTSQKLVRIGGADRPSETHGANSRYPRGRGVGPLRVLDTNTQIEQMAAHSSVPGMNP